MLWAFLAMTTVELGTMRNADDGRLLLGEHRHQLVLTAGVERRRRFVEYDDVGAVQEGAPGLVLDADQAHDAVVVDRLRAHDDRLTR